MLPYPQVGGVPIKFKYKSPLALSKGTSDAERFIKYVQILQDIMGPDATQVYINPKTVPYMLAEMMQVDERFLNKPDEVKKVMQQFQDKQSLMQMTNPEAAKQQMQAQAPQPRQ